MECNSECVIRILVTLIQHQSDHGFSSIEKVRCQRVIGKSRLNAFIVPPLKYITMCDVITIKVRPQETISEVDATTQTNEINEYKLCYLRQT